MRSLGYLLLFSLIVTLISSTSGMYLTRPRCPSQLPDVDFGNCPSRSRCQADSDCGMGQSCCRSGCGLQCLSGLTPFTGMLDWLPSMGSWFGGCGGGGRSCGSQAQAPYYGKSYK